MLARSLAGGALAAAFAASFATAGQQCHTVSLPLASTNWKEVVQVPRFDAALGVLTQVEITLSGHAQGSARFESLDTAPSVVTTQWMSVITVRRPDRTLLLAANPQADFIDPVSAFDGTVDFGGTSGVTHDPLMASETVTTTAPPPASDLALFTGPAGSPGTVGLIVNAQGTSFVSGSGNIVTQFLTQAGADVTVCYVFGPDCNGNGVPDDVDVATGASTDCDQDGRPDECQPDCDGDGAPDPCEADADGNGIPDDCEVGHGLEGCSPGYWKNHTPSWPPTGFAPGDDFDTVFGVDAFQPDRTLLQALRSGGGGLDKMGRHATAALLNASHPTVGFPLTQAQVIQTVHDAISAGQLEPLATTLDQLNNLGCPLN